MKKQKGKIEQDLQQTLSSNSAPTESSQASGDTTDASFISGSNKNVSAKNAVSKSNTKVRKPVAKADEVKTGKANNKTSGKSIAKPLAKPDKTNATYKTAKVTDVKASKMEAPETVNSVVDGAVSAADKNTADTLIASNAASASRDDSARLADSPAEGRTLSGATEPPASSVTEELIEPVVVETASSETTATSLSSATSTTLPPSDVAADSATGEGESTTSTRFKEKAAAWWQASRPPFYIATLIPLFLGYLAAEQYGGTWHNMIFAFVLLACFCLHLNANLANDLFDHLQGVDAGENIGGSRVIQQGKISPHTLSRVIGVCYALVALLAFIGAFITGHYLILLIVAFAIFSSLFYVAPPVKYGHRALGELFCFLNMGLVMVTGTYYTITGSFSSKVLALSIPVGLMVAGILYFQSLPEIETDKAAGKLTLAGYLGPEKAVFLYKLWWPAIWVLMLMLWFTSVCTWVVCVGILLSLPLHKKAAKLLNDTLQQETPDWLALDAHGKLVRLMYLFCGLSMLFAV